MTRRALQGSVAVASHLPIPGGSKIPMASTRQLAAENIMGLGESSPHVEDPQEKR